MALGADDEQAAGLADPVRLPGNLRLVLLHALSEHLPGVQNLLVIRLGVAGGLGNQLIGEARLAQVVFREELGVAAQHDVGAAAGHVLGVEKVVLDALLGEQLAEVLVLLNGHRTHQHGLALGVALLDLLDHRPVFGSLGLVDHVVVIFPGQGAVGGDLDDVQLVDGAELFLLGQGSTGHAGELVVQAEVVLEGDGSQGLALPLHRHPLLGLDGLVEALAVAPAEHETAGELVNNDDLAVLDDVINVPLHHAVGLDGLVDVEFSGSERFSTWKYSSALEMPLAVRVAVRAFSSTM